MSTVSLSPRFISSVSGVVSKVALVWLSGSGGPFGKPLFVSIALMSSSSPASLIHSLLFCTPVFESVVKMSMLRAAHHW